MMTKLELEQYVSGLEEAISDAIEALEAGNAERALDLLTSALPEEVGEEEA